MILNIGVSPCYPIKWPCNWFDIAVPYCDQSSKHAQWKDYRRSHAFRIGLDLVKMEEVGELLEVEAHKPPCRLSYRR